VQVRPSRGPSIVKELVENSIDAGRNQDTHWADGGGKCLVKVTGDGCGIGQEDLCLAFQ
jgi:DNA mismatch repair protein MutL